MPWKVLENNHNVLKSTGVWILIFTIFMTWKPCQIIENMETKISNILVYIHKSTKNNHWSMFAFIWCSMSFKQQFKFHL